MKGIRVLGTPEVHIVQAAVQCIGLATSAPNDMFFVLAGDAPAVSKVAIRLSE